MSNVRLCMPDQAPARFASCLAPYLKGAPPQSEHGARREAEQLICILSILSAIMPHLRGTLASLTKEMESDLLQLIKTHKFQQVIYLFVLCSTTNPGGCMRDGLLRAA